MARSRKAPYVTDQQGRGPGVVREAKRRAARAVRAANKKACREDAADTVADGKCYRKLGDSYDIRDFSFRDDSPKGRRK